MTRIRRRYTTAVVFMVSATVILSFGFASYALKVSVDQRNETIRLNATRSFENHAQLMRACERISVIVSELDRLTPDFQLRHKLQAVDRHFPNLEPCFGGKK